MHLVLIFGLFNAIFAAANIGGGSCTPGKWPACAEYGGHCVNGTCVCYPDYACDYCQSSSSSLLLNGGNCLNATFGGGDCITNINGCSANGTCTVGADQVRFCQCFDGYVCNDCSLTMAQYLAQNMTCPPPYNRTEPFGGGACVSQKDCGNFNGDCVGGVCKCFVDRICGNCQMDVNSVATYGCPSYDQFGGGNCRIFGECFDPFGKCQDGKCLCGQGRICGNCQASFAQWKNASGNCSVFPLKNYTFGGGKCFENRDCGNSSGLCVDNACQCFTNFVCSHCDRTVVQIDQQGQTCPVVDVQSSANSFSPVELLYIFVLVVTYMCF